MPWPKASTASSFFTEKMKKRQDKRVKKSPDEYFTAGPFEFARFGKTTVSKSRATKEQFKAAQAAMAKRLPAIVAEIDELVLKISNLVARLPPDRLLHRAWREFAAVAIGLADKDADDAKRTAAMRMIDYVQSVIASVKPREPYTSEVGDEDWATLSEYVRTLFTRLTFEYQVCQTAHMQAQDSNLNMELEEFRVQAELLWMNVRGARYQVHERQALLDVLAPHSNVLVRLYGVDAFILVAELEKILAKLTRGLGWAFNDMAQFRDDVLNRISDLSQETGSTDLHDLQNKVLEDRELAARYATIAGEIAGIDLFDVEKITKLPKALLDELAWSPGEENEFFAPGQFCGWPLRVWPSLKRPFLRLGERILCFDMFSLFDNFYRVLQRLVFRLAPDYKETWNNLQKEVSEELPFTYLVRLLPGASVYRPVYYRWKVAEGPPQWYEADGLLIYDDHLFVIEVKAGAFTYTSPATDLQSHITSLKSLVAIPASQGSRFLDYLESTAEVPIADAHHKEIGRLRRSNFRHITVCAITLDAFTELAARAQHLRSVGIDVGRRAVWALSIDDLRVYADLFDNPLVFLHFVEQRMRASHSEFADLNGEMDHLGLYVAYNNYSQYAKELMGSRTAHVTFNGYSMPIDEYFSALAQDEPAVFPWQKMPARLSEIVVFLSVSPKPGRSQLASFLLDASGEDREAIGQAIEKQLHDNAVLGRARPMSTIGDHAFTLWVWSPSAPRDTAMATEHTRALVAAHGEPTRLMVELEYSADGALLETHWGYVDLVGMSSTEVSRARDAGALVLQQRVTAARALSKIGVNEPCPCGSGRKYKRCCRP